MKKVCSLPPTGRVAMSNLFSLLNQKLNGCVHAWVVGSNEGLQLSGVRVIGGRSGLWGDHKRVST